MVIAVTAILAVYTATPALQEFLVLPKGEAFTELWLLGPGHMTENYPYNITSGQSYDVFLGVFNHLGNVACYSIQVKIRNQIQSEPSSMEHNSSNLPVLFNLYAVVADNESWELPVRFGFDYYYDSAQSKVVYTKFLFNDKVLTLSGYSTSWDTSRSSFFANLIFELSVYDRGTGSFQYHERYVDLKFNMTI